MLQIDRLGLPHLSIPFSLRQIGRSFGLKGHCRIANSGCMCQIVISGGEGVLEGLCNVLFQATTYGSIKLHRDG